MRCSNDEDYVPLPQPEKRTKKSLPKPQPPPDYWVPMELPDGIPHKGRLNIPEHLDRRNARDLFGVFFDEIVMNKLTRFTNRNYKLNGLAKDRQEGRPEMKPVRRAEMAGFIGILIYAGTEAIKDMYSLWNTDEASPIHMLVQRAMSRRRWKKINKWFCLYAKGMHEKPGDKSPHQKVDAFSRYLQKKFMAYWIPGRNLAIDEAIVRFQGRASETVNIPTKPDPIGFKVWLLGDNGYIMSWRFHTRGGRKHQGPQFHRRKHVRRGWNKTQAVVLDLVEDLPNCGKGYVIWLDNLFVSSRLLSYLRWLGIGCAGTCRTTKTKREKQHEKDVGITEADEVSLVCFSCFLAFQACIITSFVARQPCRKEQ
jgi:hypothetical protein